MSANASIIRYCIALQQILDLQILQIFSTAVSQSAVSQSAGVTSASSLHAQTDTGGSDLSSVQFPVTALATVSSGCLSRRAHILMDSDSSITLVTARLANSINAPKIKSCKIIRGMQNSTVARSSHAVRLTLEPFSDSSNEPVIILAQVVDWITDMDPQDLSSLRNQPFLRGKHLADQELGRFGMVDILLSVVDTNRCIHDVSVSSPDRSTRAWQSIFGWVVGGQIRSFSDKSNCLKLASEDDRTDEVLQRFWEQEEVADSLLTYSKEDKHALELFHDTTVCSKSGRYIIQLPKKEPTMSLGESRGFAMKRYYQNKRLLTRKGQWTSFHKGLDEYRVLGHAELVPASEFSSPSSQVYYLPTHGIVKESSTTTKLRIVFDSSAKSSNNLSLNDILCPGPSLYPLITTDLIVT